MIPVTLQRGANKRFAPFPEDVGVSSISKRQLVGFARWKALLALLIGIVIGTALTELSRTSVVGGPSRRMLRGVDSQNVARLAFAIQPGEPRYKRCRGATPDQATPHLRSVRQWFSSKARQRESITVVTQLSLERLEMLENSCGVWPDPIAAAVYVPLVRGQVFSAQEPSLNHTSLEAAVALLDAFVERMHLKGPCALDVELVMQDFGDEGEAGLYPFNAARNRALMLAQTEALLLLDADFVPSPGLAADVKVPEAYDELMRQLDIPSVIVLPAFEASNLTKPVEREELAMAAVQRDKSFVVDEYQKGRLAMFAMHFEKGHNYTLYDRWISQDEPYEVQHETGYEPYVLVSRRYVPWYDERFMGYGWDKIVFIMDLAGLGMPFTVHPKAFVVHMPHKTAPTYQATKRSGYRDKLFELFREVFHGIRKDRFKPVVSFPQLCQSDEGLSTDLLPPA